MDITVVIATYNRRELLARTLPSVLGQDYPPGDYEIILVVDGSTDGTAQYVRSLRTECRVEVLEQENRGPAAARNAGIGAAAGEVALFLDDDIRCDRGLLREHAEAHAAENGVLVHGAVWVAPESPPTLVAWGTDQWNEHYNAACQAAGGLQPHRSGYLNVNSSVDVEVLRQLGGFDETVAFPREDFELGLRIWKSGVPFRYRPRATAYEVFTKPSRAFVRGDASGYGRAEVTICRKHPDYRPHSLLAPSDRPRPLRTVARRALIRLPQGAESLLDPPVEVTERLISRPRARDIGARLLGLQHRIVLQRTAREAAGSARAFEEEFDRRLPVLLYHRVGEGSAGLDPFLSVSPLAFERQVAWLARRGFTGIRPSEWQSWREGRGGLARKPVLFTFDDAYAELGEHALPILRRHGFGAVVFVVTGAMGGVNTWDPVRGDGPRPALMSAEEIARWAGEGIDFGAHGRTHRNLLGLDAAELEDEVCGSRGDLERVVGKGVTCFAYTFGSHSPAARDLVAATYALAFTADEGVNGLRTDPHLLRRLAVSPTELLVDLHCRARYGRVPLGRARSLVQARSRAERLASTLRRPSLSQ